MVRGVLYTIPAGYQKAIPFLDKRDVSIGVEIKEVSLDEPSDKSRDDET